MQSSTLHEMSKVVSNDIQDVNAKASIPTVERNSIVVRVKRLVNNVHELSNNSEEKTASKSYIDKPNSFTNLFEICCCKCYDSGPRKRSQCSCPYILRYHKKNWTSRLIRKVKERW